MSTKHNFEITDFDKLCRTCAAIDNLSPLYENATLLVMLRQCTQVEYNENDSLPKQICSHCVKQLIHVYNFSNKCKMIDNAFRKCLNDFIKKDSNTIENIFDEQINGIFSSIDLPNNQPEQLTSQYQCSQCFIYFDTCKNLKTHMKMQHDMNITEKEIKNKNLGPKKQQKTSKKSSKTPKNPTEKYKCLECPKSYTLMKDLKLHLFTHTNEKPFKCQICGHGFLKNSLLRHHLRIHSGEKPYSCATCNKKFRHPHSLTVHNRVHSGFKPYVCDFTNCGKAFAQISCLIIHKRIHSGDRPFVCQVCGKTWISKHKLLVHSRTHTGEKRHICGVCSKGFTQAVNLRNHMKIHNNVMQGLV